MITVVTGATGHLGCNLVRELVHRGRRVRAMTHFHGGHGGSLDGIPCEKVPGDVLDPESLRAAFRGADVVHHLAAIISIDGDHGGLVGRVNIDGARNVADAALDCGVRRLLHCCSVHAFDQRPLDEPLDETRRRVEGPGHPAYDLSKAGGEREVRRAIERGLDAVILHPTGIVGPRDFVPSRMGHVFLDLYGRRLPATVDGGFDWVDVRDVALGLIAAEQRGRRGESYILGGNWCSMRELSRIAASITNVRAPRWTLPLPVASAAAPFAELYYKMSGATPLFTREALHALRGNRRVSSEKAVRELGHAPRPLSESIRDVYEWFEARGALGDRSREEAA